MKLMRPHCIHAVNAINRNQFDYMACNPFRAFLSIHSCYSIPFQRSADKYARLPQLNGKPIFNTLQLNAHRRWHNKYRYRTLTSLISYFSRAKLICSNRVSITSAPKWESIDYCCCIRLDACVLCAFLFCLWCFLKCTWSHFGLKNPNLHN